MSFLQIFCKVKGKFIKELETLTLNPVVTNIWAVFVVIPLTNFSVQTKAFNTKH